MKTQQSRRKNGFTLVELLVVITIIAVLAGVAAPMALGAIQKARKATALATCTALESAVNNFYTEYGAMPTTRTTDTVMDTKTDVNDFIDVLLGLETGSTPMNTRAVKLLSVQEGKARKNGLIYSTAGTKVLGLFDPWGGPYKVILDCDYDERVKPTPSAGGKLVTLNGRRVAAWSNGADAIRGTGGKSTDDVKTW